MNRQKEAEKGVRLGGVFTGKLIRKHQIGREKRRGNQLGPKAATLIWPQTPIKEGKLKKRKLSHMGGT